MSMRPKLSLALLTERFTECWKMLCLKPSFELNERKLMSFKVRAWLWHMKITAKVLTFVSTLLLTSWALRKVCPQFLLL